MLKLNIAFKQKYTEFFKLCGAGIGRQTNGQVTGIRLNTDG